MNARDKYLEKKYGITSEDYARMMLDQEGACKCCGQVPTGRDLHVDHDHKIAKEKIKVSEVVPGKWIATIARFAQCFEAANRLDVKAIATKWLLKKSVRGLLCWKCNEGLRAFKNRPDVCHRAGNYLEAYAASL